MALYMGHVEEYSIIYILLSILDGILMRFHQHNAYLRLRAGDEWGLTQGVTQGVTLGVTEGVPLGVDCADVVSLSSLKSPLGILNFCTEEKNNTSN